MDEREGATGSGAPPALTDVTHFLTSAVIPAFSSFVGFVRENVSWLGPLTVGLIGVVGAFKLISGALTLFDIAFKASTIGMIVTVAVAAGVALYELWTRSETFRTIVIAVFNAVGDTATWLWTKILQPTFAAIGAAWQWTVDASRAAWVNVLQPTWDAVATVATWLWTNVLSPVFERIAANWQIMVTVISWYWENVLHPLWTAVAAVATWLWQNILAPVFTAIGVGFQVLVAGMVWWWDTALHPMWNVIATVITWLWQNILGPTFLAILGGWNTLITGMVWAWDTVLHPAWNVIAATATWLWQNVLAPTFAAIGAGWSALMNGMRWAYDSIIHPMWTIMASAIGWVRDVFANVVSAIGNIWDRVKAMVAIPVNFVINTVLNNGLFAAWNWIVDLLNLPGNGKPVGTAGSWKLHVNPIGGYAHGGLIPGTSPNSQADNIPLWATAREFMQPVSAVDRYGIPFMEAVRTGRFPAEIARAYAGGGEVTYPRLTQWVFKHLRGAVVTSAYRPGARDYHGQGMAVDISNPGNVLAVNNNFARAIMSAFGNITELIHNPNASVKNGRVVPSSFWGASTWAQHLNHVHWAMTPAALGSEGLGGGMWGPFGAIGDVLSKLNDSIIQPTKDLLSRFGGGGFMQALAAFPKWIVGKLWASVKDRIASIFASTNTDDVMSGVSGSVQEIVKSVFSTRSWHTGPQWTATSNIVSRESGWNPNAQNSSSSASGLFQMIDGTWRSYRPASASGAAHMKNASVGDQALAGRNYIAARYGSPVDAWAYWQAHRYYGRGGAVTPELFDTGGLLRVGHVGVNLGTGDDRVLSPPQDTYFRRFVEWAEEERGKEPVSLVGTVVHGDLITQDVDQFLTEQRRSTSRVLAGLGLRI